MSLYIVSNIINVNVPVPINAGSRTNNERSIGTVAFLKFFLQPNQ